jgi:hypothetical protein
MATLLLAAACAGPLPERFPPSRLASGDGELDLRVAFHVHTDRSPDSRGSAEELVSLARELGIDVLVLADHDAPPALDVEGLHGDPPVLVVAGQEVGTPEGHLLVLGPRDLVRSGLPAAETIERVRREGGLAIVSHPTYPFLGWKGEPVADGLEIYNLATDLVDDLPFWTVLRFALLAPIDGTLALRAGLGGPGRSLQLWDEWLARGPVVGLGACDSHDNYGIGHRDRLRVVTTRVLARRVDVESVLEAIRLGRAYVAFERLVPVRSFRFEIEGPDERTAMGETSRYRGPRRARVRIESENDGGLVVLMRDGRPIDSARAAAARGDSARPGGGECLFPIPGPGVYRIEVRLGEDLWIVSNPIRLEP